MQALCAKLPPNVDFSHDLLTQSDKDHKITPPKNRQVQYGQTQAEGQKAHQRTGLSRLHILHTQRSKQNIQNLEASEMQGNIKVQNTIS